MNINEKVKKLEQLEDTVDEVIKSCTEMNIRADGITTIRSNVQSELNEAYVQLARENRKNVANVKEYVPETKRAR